MNEEALKDAYSLFSGTGYNGDINEFQVLLSDNADAFADSYGLFTQAGYNGTEDDYQVLLGLKKKGSSEVSTSTSEAGVSASQEPELPFGVSAPSTEEVTTDVPEEPILDIAAYLAEGNDNGLSVSESSDNILFEIQAGLGVNPNDWSEANERKDELEDIHSELKGRFHGKLIHPNDFHPQNDAIKEELDSINEYIKSNKDAIKESKFQYNTMMFDYSRSNATSNEELQEAIDNLNIDLGDVRNGDVNPVLIDGKLVSFNEAHNAIMNNWDLIERMQKDAKLGFKGSTDGSSGIKIAEDYANNTEEGKYLQSLLDHQLQSGGTFGDNLDAALVALGDIGETLGYFMKQGPLTPTSLATTLIGVKLEEKSGELKEHYESKIRLSDYDSISKAIADDKWDIAGSLVGQGMASTTVHIGLATLTGPAAPYTMGIMTGAGRYKELMESKSLGIHNMSDSAIATDALGHAVFETIFEVVTFKMLKGMAGLHRTLKPNEVIPNSFFKSFLKPIVPNMVKEGGAEVGTTIGQRFTDFITGAQMPETQEDFMAEIYDAAISGAAFMGTTSGLSASVAGSRIGIKKMFKQKGFIDIEVFKEGKLVKTLDASELRTFFMEGDNLEQWRDGSLTLDASKTAKGRELMIEFEKNIAPEVIKNNDLIKEESRVLGELISEVNNLSEDGTGASELVQRINKIVVSMQGRMAAFGVTGPNNQAPRSIAEMVDALNKKGITLIVNTKSQSLVGAKVVENTEATEITSREEYKAVKEQLDGGKSKPVVVSEQNKVGYAKDGEVISQSEVKTKTFKNKAAAQKAIKAFEKANRKRKPSNKKKRADNYTSNNKLFRKTKADDLTSIPDEVIESGKYHTISAGRGKLSSDANNKRHDNLKAILDKMDGVEYYEVQGVWEGKGEKSLVITGLTDPQAKSIGNQFNQDSVLSGEKGLLHQNGAVTPLDGDAITGPKSREESGLTIYKDKDGKKRSISLNLGKTQFGETITNDNVTEVDDAIKRVAEQYDPKRAKIIGQLVKLMSLGKGVKFKIFRNSDALYNEIHEEMGYNVKDAKAASTNRAFFRGKDGFIYVNMEAISENTLFHEIAHPLVSFIKAQNPELYSQIETAVKNSDIKDLGKDDYDSNGRRTKVSYYQWAKSRYTKLAEAEAASKGLEGVEASDYIDSYIIEEAFAEMMGDTSNSKYQFNDSALGYIRDVLRQILRALTPKKLRNDVENITLGEFSDLGSLRDDLSKAFSEGVEIEVGGKTFTIEADPQPTKEVKEPSDLKFQLTYEDPTTGITKTYDTSSDEFQKLEDEGYVNYDVSIQDFEGKQLLVHQPDSAFSGLVIDKEGNTLIEGNGGVFYPIKFHEDGYFWASTTKAAKEMTNTLNSMMEENGGKIFMALTSAPVDKLLSSTNASSGVLNLFSSEGTLNRLGINKLKAREVIINAANASSLNTNFKLSQARGRKFDKVKEDILEALSATSSKFPDRKSFSVELIGKIVEHSKGTESEAKLLDLLRGYAGEQTPFKGDKLTKKGAIKAVSMLIQEPSLKKFNNEKTGKVYAILEIDGPVVAVNSSKHKSYPVAIKAKGNAKTKLHFLKDNPAWVDVFESYKDGKLIKDRRVLSENPDYPNSMVTVASKIMPTNKGVSNKPLRLNTSEIKAQVNDSWHGGSNLFARFKDTVLPKKAILKHIDVAEPKGSEGFKEWFGKSVFKDSAGNPTPMYHGTQSEEVFDSFDTRSGLHHGAFFTPDTEFAENFNYSQGTRPSRTIPVYLKVERPFDYSDKKTWDLAIESGVFTERAIEKIKKQSEEVGVNWALIEQKIQELEVIGYDGVFIAEGGIKNIAVFNPEHIRSIWRKDFTDADDIKFQAPDAFRAGDLVTKAEIKSNFKATIRGTGHFGTGFYFFGKKSDAMSYNKSEVGIQREVSELNLSNYNLAKGTLKLHSALKSINDRVVKVNMGKVTPSDISSISNITGVSLVSKEVNPYESLTSRNIKEYNELLKSNTEKELSKAFNDYRAFDKNRDKPLIDAANSINSKLKDSDNPDTASTLIMKELGFEGVDSRGTELDNGIYGTVVYDIKFQIVGEKADLGDKVENDLIIASQAEGYGMPPKEIRLLTGWERGADGKWRYEIDDSASKLRFKPSLTDLFNVDLWKGTSIKVYKLKDILDHPELFKAYDGIENLKVILKDAKDDNVVASYNSESETISINISPLKASLLRGDSNTKMKETILHEIQHAIQSVEGFDSGTNIHAGISFAMYKSYPKLKTVREEHKKTLDLLLKVEKSYRDNLDKAGYVYRTIEQMKADDGLGYTEADSKNDKIRNTFYPEYRDRYGALSSKLEKLDNEDRAITSEAYKKKPRHEWVAEGYKAYEAKTGEVESRNVESRLGMTPEQRRSTLLSLTEDIAREDQIRFSLSEDMEFQSNAVVSINSLPEGKRSAEQWVKAIGEGLKGASREVNSMGLLEVLQSFQKDNKVKSLDKGTIQGIVKTLIQPLETIELSTDKGTPITYKDFEIKEDDGLWKVIFPNKEWEHAEVSVDDESLTDQEIIDDALQVSAYNNLEGYINDIASPKGKGSPHYASNVLKGGVNYREVLIKDASTEDIYKAPHYGDLGQNVIVTARMDDRVGPNGEKVLFVQEIQSDWVQGSQKKGFKTDDNISKINLIIEDYQSKLDALNVESDAVWEKYTNVKKGDVEGNLENIERRFKGIGREQTWYSNKIDEFKTDIRRLPNPTPWDKTDLWVGLAIRKIINQASKEGYDQIAFVNGEQSDIVQGHTGEQMGNTHHFYNNIIPKNINNELNRLVKGMRYEIENTIDISNYLTLKSDDFLESRTYTETIGNTDIHTFNERQAYKPKLKVSNREDGNSYITTEFTDPNTGELFEKTFNKFEQYKDSYDSIEKVKNMPMVYFLNLASASLFKSINDKFPSPKKEYPNAVINLTPELKEATANTGVLKFQTNDDSGQISLTPSNLSKLKNTYDDIKDNFDINIEEGMISLYHFSPEKLQSIDPRKAVMSSYSREEYRTWGRSRVFFYTDPSNKEGMVGGVLHEAVLPIDRLYPLSEDPLKLQEIAAENIKKEREGDDKSQTTLTFETTDVDAANASIARIVDILKDDGLYDLVNIQEAEETKGFVDGKYIPTSVTLTVSYPLGNKSIKTILEDGSDKAFSEKIKPSMTPYNLFEETAKLAESMGFTGYIYDHVGGKTVTSWEAVEATTDRFQLTDPRDRMTYHSGTLSIATDIKQSLLKFDYYMGRLASEQKWISKAPYDIRFTRLFGTPQGAHSNKAIKQRFIETKGEIAMHIHAAEVGIKRLKKAVKDSDYTIRELNDLLRNKEDINKLPKGKIKEALLRARRHMDHLSEALINEGIVSGEMIYTLDSNMGIYMTRRYKAYETSNWSRKVSPEVKDRAREFLYQEMKKDNPDITDAEVDGYLNKLLLANDLSDLKSTTFSGKLGEKKSIFMQRKDIPEEIRDLLGEIDDSDYNYINTVSKISTTLASHKLYNHLLDIGMGDFIATKKGEPEGDNIYQLTGVKWGPLEGHHVNAEMFAVLNETFAEQEAGPIMKFVLTLTSLAKKAKTIWSPATHARNLMGNADFAIMNGHWRVGKMYEASQVTWNAMRKLDDGEMSEFYSLLTNLGVVSSNTSLQEIRGMMETVSKDDFSYHKHRDGLLGKIGKAASSIDRGAQEAYQAEDDVWKIFGFLNEKARYIDAGFSEANANKIAASNVRNTYPNYDEIPNIVRMIGRSPIIGTFVAFNSEVIRNSANAIKIAHTEMKSSNPKVRKIGITRMAGVLTNYIILGSVYRALGEVVFNMFIGDGEDEEDNVWNMIRHALPSWDQTGDIMVTQRGELETKEVEGQANSDVYIDYFNASKNQGTGYIKDLLRVAFQGVEDPSGRSSMENIAIRLFEPFLSEEMTMSVIKDAMDNNGNKARNPSDHPALQLLTTLGYVGHELQPAAFTSAERIIESYTDEETSMVSEYEVLALFGFRMTRVNLNRGFKFRAIDAKRSLHNRLDAIDARGGNIWELYREDKKVAEIVDIMSGQMMAHWMNGISLEDIEKTMYAVGIDKATVRLCKIRMDEMYGEKKKSIIEMKVDGLLGPSFEQDEDKE